MTENEARAINVGDSVIWHDNANDIGQVIDKGYAAFAIKWSDGQYSTISFQGDPRLEHVHKKGKS